MQSTTFVLAGFNLKYHANANTAIDKPTKYGLAGSINEKLDDSLYFRHGLPTLKEISEAHSHYKNPQFRNQFGIVDSMNRVQERCSEFNISKRRIYNGLMEYDVKVCLKEDNSVIETTLVS